MEYVEGGDLKSFIHHKKLKNEKIDEKIIWKFSHQIFDALNFMHKKNIIHRDIKPQNLFITKNMVIKIGDFGVSKLIISNEKIMTRVGTPLYLAPELVQNKNYSFNVDVWSVGCVLYLLAMMKAPFKSKNLISLGHQIVNKNHQ